MIDPDVDVEATFVAAAAKNFGARGATVDAAGLSAVGGNGSAVGMEVGVIGLCG